MTEFIEQIFHNLFGNNVWLATILIAMVPVIELKGAIPFSMSSQIWGTEALGLFSAFWAGLLGSCLVVPILVLLYKPIISFLKKTKLFRRLGQKIEERVNSKKQKVEQEIGEKNVNENESNLNKNLNKSEQNLTKNLVENEANFSQNLSEKSDKILVKIDQNLLKNDIKIDENISKNDLKKDKNMDSLKKRILSVFIFVALPFPFTGVWTGSCLAVALGLNFWQSTTTVVLGNVVAGIIIAIVSSLFGDATLIFFYALLAFILAGILYFAVRAIVKKARIKRA